MRTADIFFSHDCQSEIFGSRRERALSGAKTPCTLLQMVVELLSGQTRMRDIPPFTVCNHEGRWYCRSGNRRLAAIRLAQRYFPQRFNFVRVQVVNVDQIFLHGAEGKKPKLTTHLNGEDCQGSWMVIRETGEMVGSRPGSKEYGEDLLSLLPVPSGRGAKRPWRGNAVKPAMAEAAAAEPVASAAMEVSQQGAPEPAVAPSDDVPMQVEDAQAPPRKRPKPVIPKANPRPLQGLPARPLAAAAAAAAARSAGTAVEAMEAEPEVIVAS